MVKSLTVRAKRITPNTGEGESPFSQDAMIPTDRPAAITEVITAENPIEPRAVPV